MQPPYEPSTTQPAVGGGQRCPLCGRDASFLFRTEDRNRRVTSEAFSYGRCRLCRVVFLQNVPADLARYYAVSNEEPPPQVEVNAVDDGESYRVELVRQHVLPGRLVDVGAGFGIFAAEARNVGFDVTAIEMDARSCEYLASVGIGVIASATPEHVLPTLPPSRAVTLWHVIEHLRDPRACVEAAARNLEEDGVLVVATPNPDAVQFRMLRSRWPHVDAPRHLWLIPAPTLTTWARDVGLDLVDVTTSDPGARHWNVFGWQHFLAPVTATGIRARAALWAGALVATALSPIERRRMNGSAYTAVFRKGVSS